MPFDAAWRRIRAFPEVARNRQAPDVQRPAIADRHAHGNRLSLPRPRPLVRERAQHPPDDQPGPGYTKNENHQQDKGRNEALGAEAEAAQDRRTERRHDHSQRIATPPETRFKP